jgi:TRAP-type uncharacterized transport system fused permease subunit
MMLTWKYTLPAFLVPFVFTLSPEGMGLLLQADPETVLWASSTAALGVGALAAGFGGWILRSASMPERVILTAAGLFLFVADRRLDVAGFVLTGTVLLWHWWRYRGSLESD